MVLLFNYRSFPLAMTNYMFKIIKKCVIEYFERLFDFVLLYLIFKPINQRTNMKSIISKLFSEGDFYLKEAKAKFYLKKEEQCDAICCCCNAIKKFLDAYEKFLFEHIEPSDNYHILLHTISQKDPEFKRFTEKIYEVKCFAQESSKDKEGFFLYADEIDETIKIIIDIREYIASKVDLRREFLEEYTQTSFMTT